VCDKLCIQKVFTLGAEDAYGWTQNEMVGQCVDISNTIQWARWWPLELHSHRGWDIVVARNPWIKAIHGLEAHIIANKEKIRTHDINLQDHVHSVLGQKKCSPCGILASRLNRQCRCLLRHAWETVSCNPEQATCMLSRGVVMLHDNACHHTTTTTQDLIATFGWEQFTHPPTAQT
jgi:hypothetical protein